MMIDIQYVFMKEDLLLLFLYILIDVLNQMISMSVDWDNNQG